jgi:homoserine dehydrogenase
MKTIKLGLLGMGVVGSGVVKLIEKNRADITRRLGADLIITKVAVRDLTKPRSVSLPEGVVTDDPYAVINDPDIDIVIEVMGGDEPARSLILQAIAAEKHVVTANKHLLALHGDEIYAACESKNVALGFEASVAGAVPVVRAIRDGFSGNRIESVYGIINGTCNYILTRMAEDGSSFEQALMEAQQLGFAEADPTFDVEGIDTAHKIAILASLAYQTGVDFHQIHVEGITGVGPEDIEAAKEFGYVIKLLAVARRQDDRLEIHVNPAMIPVEDQIASVGGAMNAVELNCGMGGINTLVGPGAGEGPTSSAIMADVVEIARHAILGDGYPMPPMGAPIHAVSPTPIIPMDQLVTCYYLRFQVADQPGVMARIAGALGECNISIATMYQNGRQRKANKPVSVMMTTHTACEADVKRALDILIKSNILLAPTTLIRMEGGE